jgi:hypothetical protein
MSILLPVPEATHTADAPLFVQLPDNNFKTRLYDVALHTLPILILIIVHNYRTHSKKIILDAIVYKRKTHLLQKVKQ